MVEVKNKTKSKKKGKKVWRWLWAGFIVLILAVVFGVPVLLSSGFARRMIVAKINGSIDGHAEMGGFSMSWWRGIRVRDFRFQGNDGRMKVEVDGISTKPHYASLLGGNLSLGSTQIDRPVVEINLPEKHNGKSESAHDKVHSGGSSGTVGLPVSRIDLIVNNGSFKVTDSQARTSKISSINSRLKLRPPGERTYASASMSVSDGSKPAKVRVQGDIAVDKKKGWTLEGAGGEFSVDVNGLDLESLGALFALAGVEIDAKGTVSGKLESTITEGELSKVTAVLSGKGIEVGGAALKGDILNTPQLGVKIELQRQGDLIKVDKLEADGTWLWCKLSGVVPTTFDALEQFVKPDSPYNLQGSFGCDVAAAAAQIPHVLGLKEGMKVTSGKVRGKVDTTTQAGHKSLVCSASLSELGGVVDDKKVGLSAPVDAAVQVTSDGGVLKFDKLDVSSSFMNLTGSGTAERLKYEAQADLVKLQSELGQFVDMKGYKLSGSAWEKGEIGIVNDRITMKGNSGIEDFRVTSPNGVSAYEPKAAINFSMAVEPNLGIISIDMLKMTAGLGEIEVSDSVVAMGEKAQKETRLGISVRQLDIGKLGQFGKVFGYFPEKAELGGVVDANMVLGSNRQQFSVMTDAAKVKGLKVAWPGKKPFEQEDVFVTLDVKGDTAKKTISVKKFRLISPQIKIEGQMEQRSDKDKMKLSGKADMEYDWKALTGMLGAYLPAGLELEGARKDSLSFSSEYSQKQGDGLVENLNTRAALGFDKGGYMGLNFGPTQVEVEVAKGVLQVKPFSTKVNNGRLNFSARANLKEKPAVLKTVKPMQIIDDVEITDEMGSKLFSFLNPVFGDVAGVSGMVDFNCTELSIPLGGEAAENLVVEGTIAMKNVQLKGGGFVTTLFKLFGRGIPSQNFTLQPTLFTVRDGAVRYDNMQIDVGDNPFNFSGRIGLDKRVDMTVTVPWTLEGETARTGRSTKGERVSLPLMGTTDKIKIDTAALLKLQLQKQLKKRIGDEILKGIGDILK